MRGIDIELPLPRLSWDEAMNRFGSDKPDLRFGFELRDLADAVKDSAFNVFTDALSSGRVMGIKIDDGSRHFNRKDIDKMTEAVKDFGAKGLVWIRFEESEIKSSVNKFFDQEQLRRIGDVFEAKAASRVYDH